MHCPVDATFASWVQRRPHGHGLFGTALIRFGVWWVRPRDQATPGRVAENQELSGPLLSGGDAQTKDLAVPVTGDAGEEHLPKHIRRCLIEVFVKIAGRVDFGCDGHRESTFELDLRLPS